MLWPIENSLEYVEYQRDKKKKKDQPGLSDTHTHIYIYIYILFNNKNRNEQDTTRKESNRQWETLDSVLWYIYHCRLFNAKSCFYIYIKYIWFVNTFWRYTLKWSNSSFSNNSIQHKSTKLDGSKYCYISLTILLNINYIVYTQLNVESVLFQTIQFMSFICAQFKCQTILFKHGTYQLLPLWTRVDRGAMAMKGYSVFAKCPILLEPHHQIVKWYQDTRLERGVLHLYRDVVGVFCSKRNG